MNFILKTTDTRKYAYIAVDGTEPLRNYRKTRSLLQSRLRDTFPQFADMLAEPAFTSDGKIKWSTDMFSSLPRPLNSLTGEERGHYVTLLKKSMSQLREALRSLPAASDVAELHAIATVPSEETIYCADDRIVIAEWGLRPASGGSAALSLLSFADRTKKTPQQPRQDNVIMTEKKDPVVKPEKPVEPHQKPVIVNDADKAKEKRKDDETHDNRQPAVKSVVPPVVPPVVDPVVNPDAGNGRKPRRRTWLWVLIGVIIALLALAAVLLLTRCSSAETVANLPAKAPEIKQENIVLTDDSMTYVVNNRLNIMVLDGGTLDEFIGDFRKEYPDKEMYVLSSPDTVVNHILLTLPPEETKEMMKEIPVRMKPKYRVIVAPEGISNMSYVPSDPAMKVQDESYYFDMVNAPEAWDIEKGDPDLTVAVLDDGFDTSHPEIASKCVDPFDTYTNTPGTRPSKGGHGQHTSATAVGAADNNSGACGIAPGCSLMPINVFIPGDGAPDSLVIKGLVYAAKHGAKVISMSLGHSFGPQVKFLPPQEQLARASRISPELAEMYDEVFRQLDEMGITVVISAGNETILTVMDPMKRSKYPIIVSAVDSDGDIAIFDPVTLNGSNWGERCDISAPGVDIYNAVPKGYDYKSGTSMSCPQVAGGAALVLSRYPQLKPQQVKELLVKTAVPVDEHIGPLMDLAAALKANPDDLADMPDPGKPADPGRTPRRGQKGDRGTTDPYSFFYSQKPSPQPAPAPGDNPSYTPGGSIPPGTQPGGEPADCAEGLRELQRLQQQYEALIRRYGHCI